MTSMAVGHYVKALSSRRARGSLRAAGRIGAPGFLSLQNGMAGIYEKMSLKLSGVT